MGRVKWNKKAPTREPSFSDQQQFEAMQAAGLAIGNWFTGINMHRSIITLTRDELRHIAEVAVSEWILVRARQEREEGEAHQSYLMAG